MKTLIPFFISFLFYPYLQASANDADSTKCIFPYLKHNDESKSYLPYFRFYTDSLKHHPFLKRDSLLSNPLYIPSPEKRGMMPRFYPDDGIDYKMKYYHCPDSIEYKMKYFYHQDNYRLKKNFKKNFPK